VTGRAGNANTVACFTLSALPRRLPHHSRPTTTGRSSLPRSNQTAVPDAWPFMVWRGQKSDLHPPRATPFKFPVALLSRENECQRTNLGWQGKGNSMTLLTLTNWTL
jgi:hypothetical protein